MLSEGLRIGPGRMKALENLLSLLRADPGSLVGDMDGDLIPIRGCRYLDKTAFGGKRDSIVEQIAEHPLQTSSVPHHPGDIFCRSREGDMDTEIGRPLLARGEQLLQHLADINRFKLCPRQFGIDAGGIGNVVDQPVNTANIVIGDIQQLFLQCRFLDPFQSLQRRAKRGEGVLDFMADIGSERFRGIDSIAQGRAHIGKGATQLADFIAPVRHSGNGDFV